MLKVNFKFVWTIGLFLMSLAITAQEICDNGIDDDGDMLIDLNDNDCDCDEIRPLTNVSGNACRALYLEFDVPEATSYQWYRDGIALTGFSFDTIAISRFGPTGEGTYKAIATTLTGTIGSESYEVIRDEYHTDLGEIYLCEGDTCYLNGFPFFKQGKQKYKTKTVEFNCDSTVYFELFFDDPKWENLDETICTGNTFTLGTITASEAGRYMDTLRTVAGCDSLIRAVNLMLEDLDPIEFDAKICLGDTYMFHDIFEREAGQYSTTVSSPYGCDTTFIINLSVIEPSADEHYESICQSNIYVTATATNLACNEANGAPTGAIDITVVGAHPPYSYAWSNGSVTEDLTDLDVGVYSVTVTDSNGNAHNREFALVEPTPITITGIITEPDCNFDNGVPDGGIDITVSGGTGPYLYTWTGPGSAIASNEDQYGLGEGTYDVTVTDSNGCTATTVYVLTQPSPIELTAEVWATTCNASNGPSDGQIDVTVSGGQGDSQADYTYKWSTSDGSGLVPTEADQSIVSAGTYCLIVTDSNGCTVKECFTILEPSPLPNCSFVGVDHRGTLVTCDNELALVEVLLEGGNIAKEYSYDFETFQQSPQFILGPGDYTFYAEVEDECYVTCRLNIVDPTAANNDPNLSFSECLSTVNVQFYYDENVNAVKDSDEEYLSFGSITIDTDKALNNYRKKGLYILTDSIDSIIKYNNLLNTDWYTTGQDEFDLMGDSSERIEIGLHPFTLESRVVSLVDSDRFRCGEEVGFTLSAINFGTVIDAGTVYMELDSRIDAYSFSVAPDYENGSVMGWNFSDLYPGDKFEIYFKVTAPFINSAEQVGEIYKFRHDINSDLSSNHSYDVALRCSYDPNDKQVSPRREDNLALIADPLFYKIRFQNTGNDYARKVSVVDTLDENLDLSTFKLIGTSHPDELQVYFDDGQTVTFEFNNIYLPDSTTNEPASNGHISYSIEAIDGALESEIKNTAYIYFDFNPAIVTNTTKNILVEAFPTSGSETLTHFGLEIYPNPAQDLIFLESEQELQLTIVDHTGKLLMEQTISAGKNQLSTENLENGIYIMSLTDGIQTRNEQLMILR